MCTEVHLAWVVGGAMRAARTSKGGTPQTLPHRTCKYAHVLWATKSPKSSWARRWGWAQQMHTR
jgi:hypothetical protein